MRNLSQWLEYIETAHPHTIDMGLARVSEVLSRLSLNFKDTCLITVAGTNGKGTTCRFIEQACIQADFKVGVYSSPHIEKFNERIRLQGRDACDHSLSTAFSRVDQAAKHFKGGEPISLSYFEYATLCSLVIFADAKLDICLLEVGLGGRLDATNMLDADIGVITSIGLDHQNYLGETTELIAAEKAGIIKPNQRVVIGYSDIHESVKSILKTNNSRFLASEIDFGIERLEPANNSERPWKTTTIGWINIASQRLQFTLAEANIPAQNIMTAMATLQLISEHFTCKEPLVLATNELTNLIPSVSMAGRFQTLSYSPLIVLDVAHNEDSAKYLVSRVKQMQYNHCHIVIGMLKDKNIEATIDCLADLNASWYCADLSTERGEKAKRLTNAASKHKQNSQSFHSVKLAVEQAVHHYETNDMILVVGSFILASSCISTLNELGMKLTLQGKH